MLAAGRQSVAALAPPCTQLHSMQVALVENQDVPVAHSHTGHVPTKENGGWLTKCDNDDPPQMPARVLPALPVLFVVEVVEHTTAGGG